MEKRERTLQVSLNAIFSQMCIALQKKAILKDENQRLQQELGQYKGAPRWPNVVSRTFKQPTPSERCPSEPIVLDPVLTCPAAFEERPFHGRTTTFVSITQRPVHRQITSSRRVSTNRRQDGTAKKHSKNAALEADTALGYPDNRSFDNDNHPDNRGDNPSSNTDFNDEVEENLESYLPIKLKARKQPPPLREKLTHSASFKKPKVAAGSRAVGSKFQRKTTNDSYLLDATIS